MPDNTSLPRSPDVWKEPTTLSGGARAAAAGGAGRAAAAARGRPVDPPAGCPVDRPDCPCLLYCCPPRLLEELPEILEREVLPRLDPADRTVLSQVNRGLVAAGRAFGLGARRRAAPPPSQGAIFGLIFGRRTEIGNLRRVVPQTMNPHY